MGWAEDGSWEQSGAAVRAHFCAILCRNMSYFALCCATLCLFMLYCATLQCHTTQTVFLFQVKMNLPTGRPGSSLSQAKADSERFSCFPFERVISTQQFQYTMTT